MAFKLPTFNVDVGIWRPGTPTSSPPDVTSKGNLSPGRVTGTDVPAGATTIVGLGGMWLRLPAATDVRDPKAAAGADSVEVPLHSGRRYTVRWVDDIGLGFSNEHRFAIIQAMGPWPTPFPPGGSQPPPSQPPPASGLAHGSNGGAPSQTLTLPVVVPGSGALSVVVVQYNNNSNGTLNGFQAIPATRVAFSDGQNGAQIQRFLLPVGPGNLNLVHDLGAGHAARMQMNAVFLPLARGIAFVNNSIIGTAGYLLRVTMPSAVAPNSFLLADFGVLGYPPVVTWHPPFVDWGVDDSGSAQAYNVGLTSAGLSIATPQTPDAAADCSAQTSEWAGIYTCVQ